MVEAKAKAKARGLRGQGQGQGQESSRPRPRPQNFVLELSSRSRPVLEDPIPAVFGQYPDGATENAELVWVYLHTNLCSVLQTTHLFCNRGHFGRSRSFKVIQGR